MFIDDIYYYCDTKKAKYIACNSYINYCRYFTSKKKMKEYVKSSDIPDWEFLMYNSRHKVWFPVDFVKNRLYIVDVEPVEVTEAL